MKKIILCSVLIFALAVETSCGGRFQNTAGGGVVSGEAVSGEAVSGEAVSGEAVSGEAISSVTEENGEHTEKKPVNITFTDVLGNKQKMKADGINTGDAASHLSRAGGPMDSFVKDNHFYYCNVETAYQDKGQILCGDIDGSSYVDLFRFDWGEYRGKLYITYSMPDLPNGDFPEGIQFRIIDLNTWETKEISCSEPYYPYSVNVFVYNEKIYVSPYDNAPNKLDEIDMNGKKVRTISFENKEGKESSVDVQGIVDGKIYYLTEKDNLYVLRSKDLVTGEEKEVLQYGLPPRPGTKKYNEGGSQLRMSGDNLFIKQEFWYKEKRKHYTRLYSEYRLYCLPIKEGEKMKCLGEHMAGADFINEDVFYIDSKHLLHRLNLKKGTDKVISERKYGHVYCTDEGLFAYKYDIQDEIVAEDEYGEDILYYMDFDGGNEKKIGTY